MSNQESRQPRNSIILILIGVSILLILGVIAALVLLAVRDNPGGSAAASIPYGLQDRAIPTTEKVSALFPAKLGDFTRKTISGDLSGGGPQRFGATYVRNDDRIIITGARDANYAQAQADLNQHAEQIGKLGVVTTLNSSFAFMKASNKDGTARLMYAHDYFFFDLTTSSGQALDDFMKAFPY